MDPWAVSPIPAPDAVRPRPMHRRVRPERGPVGGRRRYGGEAMSLDGDPWVPPLDPEEWTDDQWIAWLRATDDASPPPPPPVTTGSRIVRSPGGALLGEAMLAMSRAIYGRQDDEIVIVVDADGEPGGDERYEVHLDPEHPERSSVVFRPSQSGRQEGRSD